LAGRGAHMSVGDRTRTDESRTDEFGNRAPSIWHIGLFMLRRKQR